jgi:starvation-inducible DNA-binding protein
MERKIDLPSGARTGVCEMLNGLLSDEYVLYTKTRNCHWNVVGPNVHDLHKFCQAQYEELNDVVDSVVERVRSLGGRTEATLAGFLKRATLTEGAPGPLTAAQMISRLLADH